MGVLKAGLILNDRLDPEDAQSLAGSPPFLSVQDSKTLTVKPDADRIFQPFSADGPGQGYNISVFGDNTEIGMDF